MGGSWKKSPQRITWIPPHGRGSPRMQRACFSSSAKNSADTMLISSMIRTSTERQRSLGSFFHMRSKSLLVCGMPHPAKEWSVVPAMWVAAIPVAAVTATFLGNSDAYLSLSIWMMKLMRNDLPVPAFPVKNTLWPWRTRSTTSACSSLSRGLLAESGSVDASASAVTLVRTRERKKEGGGGRSGSARGGRGGGAQERWGRGAAEAT
mmetsp:Transcript_17077/g.40753  ORF Transcript_17077/g.40753 Transcript_17077/m.40753 type:complete len:207 (+) Transcript_17077:1460-2080(+)